MSQLKSAVSILLGFFLPTTQQEREVGTLTRELLAKKVCVRVLWNDKGIVSLFDYRDSIIKNMIWALKYKGNERAALLFAEILYDFFLEEVSDRNMFDQAIEHLLIPVPLSQERLKERGFNQVELVINKLPIKEGIAFIPSFFVLERVKHTSSQTKVRSREERKKNLKGAFYVKDKNKIKGKDILLLDDVITTGSTILEARKTLLEAGAKSVFCVGLAH